VESVGASFSLIKVKIGVILKKAFSHQPPSLQLGIFLSKYQIHQVLACAFYHHFHTTEKL
jgi:hypothetical protein